MTSNKSVMNGSNLPLTFLFLQLSVSVILLHLLALLPLRGKWSFTVPRWSRTTVLALGPLCAVNITGLVFNILCLRLVDASYFQVARGLTLPLTVVLSSVMTSSMPSKYTIASCACVSYGFAYTFMPIFSFGTGPGAGGVGAIAGQAFEGAARGMRTTEAPVLGMVLGLLSAAMVALHAVLIKTALRNVEGRTLDLAYWQNLIGALALLPAILVAREEVTLMAMLQGTTGDLAGFIKGSAVTVSLHHHPPGSISPFARAA
jgi:GDP-fucose transporter C1